MLFLIIIFAFRLKMCTEFWLATAFQSIGLLSTNFGTCQHLTNCYQMNMNVLPAPRFDMHTYNLCTFKH